MHRPPPAPHALRRRLLLAAAGLAAPAVRAAPDPGFEWRPWAPGRPVPALDLPTAAGPRWQLEQARGQVVLANFWASWCEPCREEMPALARLAERHAAQGLHVVTVNYRESAPTIERFVRSFALTLPVLIDADGEAALAWTPRIFPSSVLFDRRGRPAGVLVGAIDWLGADAQALLAPLLGT